MNHPARLHPNAWSSLEVQVLDLSETGFRAECEAAVVIGTMITLELPGLGPTEARVSWRRDGQIGAKFIAPISLEGCHWTPVSAESRLARLLVQRVRARDKGMLAEEAEVRRQILAALPVVRADSRA